MSGSRTRTTDDRTAERTPPERTTRNDEHEQEQEQERERTCPECGGRLDSDKSHGETVCADCGLVVEEDAVDRGPEWRAFDALVEQRLVLTGSGSWLPLFAVHPPIAARKRRLDGLTARKPAT